MVSRSIIHLYFLNMIILKAKQLVAVAVILLSALFIQSCSSISRNAQKAPIKLGRKSSKKSNRKMTSLSPRFENFDRRNIPNDSLVISNMISIVQPELEDQNKHRIASQISRALKKYKIEPQIIVAIIDTESDFNGSKVSSTGDLSLGQINVDVWNREFVRMKLKPMVKAKIKTDQEYALMKMAEILSIIKKRYERKDRRWYARYHSNTHKHKKEYLHKLEIRLKMLAMSNNFNTRLAMNN